MQNDDDVYDDVAAAADDDGLADGDSADSDVFSCDDLDCPIERILADKADIDKAFRRCARAYAW